MWRASTATAAPASGRDTASFAVIFGAAFCVFLCVALASQLLTGQWRSWLPGAENEKSLVGGVRSAVYTFMPLLS